MKKYRLSVCKGPDCRAGGSDRVFAAAKEAVAQKSLAPRCDVGRGGCYGLCHLGPNVIIREDIGRRRDPFMQEDFQLMGWPDEVYYSGMTPEKMVRIVAEHIEQDTPVEALRATADDAEPKG